MNISKLINIFLRGSTLLSRVILFLFIAKYLEPNQVGLFGLVLASIYLSVYAVGLEFYVYSTRELLRYNKSNWGHFLKSQCVLHVILYLLTFPLLLTLFIFKFLPWNFVVLFFLILFLEHITTELVRLLIALNKQISSSIVLFFKSGLWCIVITILIIFFKEFRALEYILLSWIFSLVVALLIALVFLYKIKIGGWHNRFKYQWIVKGLKIAIPLLISTLVIRAIFTIDRYWVEILLGSEMLGVYVLFIGFATSIMSFMDAGVFSFSYPNLVKSYNLKNIKNFNKETKLLKKNTILLTSFSAIVALIIIKPILFFINKPIYFENIFIFYWLLAVMIIYILSMIPHYLLYAQRYDKVIIKSHLIAFAIFVITTGFLSGSNPNYSVLIGLIFSFSFILIYKTLSYLKNNT